VRLAKAGEERLGANSTCCPSRLPLRLRRPSTPTGWVSGSAVWAEELCAGPRNACGKEKKKKKTARSMAPRVRSARTITSADLAGATKMAAMDMYFPRMLGDSATVPGRSALTKKYGARLRRATAAAISLSRSIRSRSYHMSE